MADGDVVTLTDENYEAQIKANPIIMVKFYAPWCGHCKAFAPEYEKAAKMIKEQKKTYVLADLDATVHKASAEKNKVQGFPTIKLFLNGIPMDYDADRKAEAVIAFIDKKTSPPSTELKTAAELKAKKEEKGLRSIYIGADTTEMGIYTEVARAINDFSFFHVSEAVAKEVFPEVAAGQVLILKDFDEGKAIFKEKLTKETLQAFIEDNMIPTVTEITQKVVEIVFKPNGRKAFILFYNPEAKDAKTVEEEYKKLAATLKKEYVFIQTGIKDGWGKRLADFFAAEESSLPSIEMVEMKEDINRYKHTGEMTFASLTKFVEDLKKGSVPRFLKSEPIPTENPGPVFKLVGKAFKKEVLENDDDILVKFYAPWCGHCKKLEPIYKSLAESLLVNKKIKFYEIDATKNDIEGHSIQGFPTLKFFPGKDKANVINYSGDRSEEDIAKFLKEKSSYPLNLPEFKSKDETEQGKDDL